MKILKFIFTVILIFFTYVALKYYVLLPVYQAFYLVLLAVYVFSFKGLKKRLRLLNIILFILTCLMLGLVFYERVSERNIVLFIVALYALIGLAKD